MYLSLDYTDLVDGEHVRVRVHVQVVREAAGAGGVGELLDQRS
jgi:hypothetical protein